MESWETEVSRQLYRDLVKVILVPFELQSFCSELCQRSLFYLFLHFGGPLCWLWGGFDGLISLGPFLPVSVVGVGWKWIPNWLPEWEGGGLSQWPPPWSTPLDERPASPSLSIGCKGINLVIVWKSNNNELCLALFSNKTIFFSSWVGDFLVICGFFFSFKVNYCITKERQVSISKNLRGRRRDVKPNTANYQLWELEQDAGFLGAWTSQTWNPTLAS